MNSRNSCFLRGSTNLLALLHRRRRRCLSTCSHGTAERFAYAYLPSLPSSMPDEQQEEGRALRELYPHIWLLPQPNPKLPSSWSLPLRHLDELHQKWKRQVDKSADAGPLRWRLVGSGLGGLLAVKWAMRNPGLVDRMVLVEPWLDPDCDVDRWLQRQNNASDTNGIELVGAAGLVSACAGGIRIPDDCPTLVLERLGGGGGPSRSSCGDPMPRHVATRRVTVDDAQDRLPVGFIMFNSLKFLGNLRHRPTVTTVSDRPYRPSWRRAAAADDSSSSSSSSNRRRLPMSI